MVQELRNHIISVFGIEYDLDDLPISPMIILPFLGVTLLGVFAIIISCLCCARNDPVIKNFKIKKGDKRTQQRDPEPLESRRNTHFNGDDDYSVDFTEENNSEVKQEALGIFGGERKGTTYKRETFLKAMRAGEKKKKKLARQAKSSSLRK